MYWTNFLHIYQPPTQTLDILEKVTNECYRPVVQVLRDNPNAKITLNINACLTEMLAENGFIDVIEGLQELANNGQIDFTGSAKYHAILPLIPPEEAKRQIRLNYETNLHYFGSAYRPLGFFFPECCYSREVAEIVREMGYKWCLIDEIAYRGHLMQVPRDRVYRLSNTEDFYVFFRERGLSNDISFGQLKRGIDFVNRFGYLIPYAGYIVSATDGEVYGHHHRGMEKFLDQLYKDGRIETATLSEILATIEQGELVDPYSCSWASYEDDLRRGIPYALWQHPNNEIHKLQWELTNLAIETVNKFPNKESYNYNKARQVLDEGLHSCQYWWASATPWWSVEMIERGARTLLISIFLLREAPSYARVKAEELYEEIMDKAGVWNETGYAQKVKTEFLSTHPDIASELTFGEKKHTHKYLKEES